jgi:membrane-bound lytic murein transglycosylase F
MLKHLFAFSRIPVFFVTCLASCWMVSCSSETEESIKQSTERPRDLADIIEERKLTILVENSTISYFIYRGKPMGLEYEILNEFAKHLGVQLEMRVVGDLDEMVPLLNENQGDIIACNLTVTKERKQQIAFSTPHMRTPQVLVQRKTVPQKSDTKNDFPATYIQSPEELLGKTVYVWQNSSYYNRLKNLQDELGDTIYVKGIDGDVIAEEVIQWVSEGIIDYTVTDQNVAMINQTFYPNIDVDLSLSVEQRIAFGLRTSSPMLLDALNVWLEKFMQTTTYRYIIHKYLNMKSFSSMAQDEFSSVGGGKLSKYDDEIKAAADEFGWDWRFLAAIIYQESKFVDGKESWAGAYGLIQFMPGIGADYGVDRDSSPKDQIRGGMKKVVKNFNDWQEIPDSIQRVKFMLATFNAGMGHVQDAQRLAEKHGLDHLVWDNNVENIILKMSKPEYYRDPLCRNGYFRGVETYQYVRKVMNRYEEYKSVF